MNRDNEGIGKELFSFDGSWRNLFLLLRFEWLEVDERRTEQRLFKCRYEQMRDLTVKHLRQIQLKWKIPILHKYGGETDLHFPGERLSFRDVWVIWNEILSTTMNIAQTRTLCSVIEAKRRSQFSSGLHHYRGGVQNIISVFAAITFACAVLDYPAGRYIYHQGRIREPGFFFY